MKGNSVIYWILVCSQAFTLRRFFGSLSIIRSLSTDEHDQYGHNPEHFQQQEQQEQSDDIIKPKQQQQKRKFRSDFEFLKQLDNRIRTELEEQKEKLDEEQKENEEQKELEKNDNTNSIDNNDESNDEKEQKQKQQKQQQQQQTVLDEHDEIRKAQREKQLEEQRKLEKEAQEVRALLAAAKKQLEEEQQKLIEEKKRLEEEKQKLEIEKKKKELQGTAIPNVLIAGTQQGGTSAIVGYLKENYNACVSDPDKNEGLSDEAHFFDKNFKQGVDYYKGIYEHCKDASLVVDATPLYFPFPRRIRDTFENELLQKDNTKIIISLREPVSREYSWYRQRIPHCTTQEYARSVCDTNDGTPYPFETVMQRSIVRKFDINRLIGIQSLYATYLKVWFKNFNREQILILNYEEGITDPDKYYERIHEFLQLPGKPSKGHVPINDDIILPTNLDLNITQATCDMQEHLSNMFEPHNNDLYKLLKSRPGPPMEQRPFQPFQENICTDFYNNNNNNEKNNDNKSIKTKQ